MTDDGDAATDALYDWLSYWSSSDADTRELLTATLVCAVQLADECLDDKRAFLEACAKAWDLYYRSLALEAREESEESKGIVDTWQN